MQKHRKYKKTRNKNRNHQASFDSPEGEGEFMNESNDSMLTISDALGNMDAMDATISSDSDKTLLDEFAGDSELSSEHDYPLGSANRSGASHKARRLEKSSAEATDFGSQDKSDDQAAPMALLIKGKLSKASTRAQELLEPYAREMNLKLQDFYRVAKIQRANLNKKVQTQPYLFALGAVVGGFALTKLFTRSSVQNR